MRKLLPTLGYSQCVDCKFVFKTNKSTAILSMIAQGKMKQMFVCDPCYNKSRRLGV